MFPLSLPRIPRPSFVGRRLRELGRHLVDLSGQVRQAVVEAVRETLAQLARDSIDGLWQGRPARPMAPYADQRPDPYDPWADESYEESWTEPEPTDAQEPTPESGSPSRAVAAGPCVLATALAAAGWWLRQRGSVLGAVGVAVLAGLAAGLTSQLADNGRHLVQAAANMLTLHNSFASLSAAWPAS